MASGSLLSAPTTTTCLSGLKDPATSLQSSQKCSFIGGLPMAGKSVMPQAKRSALAGVRVQAQQTGVSQQARTAAKEKAKRFGLRGETLGATAGASLPMLLRLGSGALVSGYSPSLQKDDSDPQTTYSMVRVAGRRLVEKGAPHSLPAKPIEIYEFEACPFCRKVREAVSFLDLDVIFYPTPQDGPTYRPKAIELGGKKQFPYMVDPNTGYSLYESDEIIKYLARTYGNDKVPFQLKLGPLTTITAGLAMLPRMGRGSSYRPAKKPNKPLELWAYEASPFCKIVREVLTELELPHLYHAVARGSAKRQQLFDMTGTFQAPYLEDPNTGVAMYESADIINYLNKEYALVT